jgi:hypothetical protein
MADGITERHARPCRIRTGGRCNCTPTDMGHNSITITLDRDGT